MKKFKFFAFLAALATIVVCAGCDEDDWWDDDYYVKIKAEVVESGLHSDDLDEIIIRIDGREWVYDSHLGNSFTKEFGPYDEPVEIEVECQAESSHATLKVSLYTSRSSWNWKLRKSETSSDGYVRFLTHIRDYKK